MLVTYSDSEGSEDEKPQAGSTKDKTASTPIPDINFVVDKSNPRKIRVNLQEKKADPTTNGDQDGEPAPKRPRIGGGFSGFNSMLPAPKKDTQSTEGKRTGTNGTPRKVFGLKTGAEPGFSRESDAELKQLFAEQGTEAIAETRGERKSDEKDTSHAARVLTLPPISQPTPPKQGSMMMFKPLSVARNTQTKKKPPAKISGAIPSSQARLSNPVVVPEIQASPPKVSLFSVGNSEEPPDASGTQVEYEPLVYQGSVEDGGYKKLASEGEAAPAELQDSAPHNISHEDQPQSLDSIASDLNLSASAKRQLLGRNHKNASKISSFIINFNTDEEYAANEALRASGEQLQHNPVRAIAPGKHSLKQLVSAASGQKEALEESFASGRRNKKEAGGKYGW
jgi:Mitotic checkpoint regulator, MAD2B-interacting